MTPLSCLGSSTSGLTMREMRKIYTGVAIPQKMHACSAWSNANWRTRDKPYIDRTLNKLQSVRARAARIISGGFKATLIPVLDVETYLLPIEQQIFKHNIDSLGRIGRAEQQQEGEGTRRKRNSPIAAIGRSIMDRSGPDI